MLNYYIFIYEIAYANYDQAWLEEHERCCCQGVGVSLAKYYSLNTGKKAEHQIIRRVIRKNSMKQCSETSMTFFLHHRIKHSMVLVSF